MKLERTSLGLLTNALKKLEAGFDLPVLEQAFDAEKMEKVLEEVGEKMQDNYPYFHPLFAGQMLKPPHPIAKAAYMLSLWINPNNHALDGGKASSKMEKEVVADLATMFGWDRHLGHLTGGGTMANLEALWVAGQIHPEKKILASDQAHYTHQRISQVLKLPFEAIRTDRKGLLDLNDLEAKLKSQEVGTVVCTMGTTGLGAVDPLPEIVALQKKYEFRIHLDAAYGGYFSLLDNLEPATLTKYQHMVHADSIVIDPHKHGLQPYGCGCVLFKNPEVAKYYLHDSPYTYYTSDELHLGEISLECSRAGAAAVGLWATHQIMPPVRNGDFSRELSQSRKAALDLHARLSRSKDFIPILVPETDIVVWTLTGDHTKEMSEKSAAFFRHAEENQLYLSLYKFPTEKLDAAGSFTINSDYLTCLRSCLMKPEHKTWMDEIWSRMNMALANT